MTTEQILDLKQKMSEANKKIKFDVSAETKYRMDALTRHAKLKTGKQKIKFFSHKPFIYKVSENFWWGFYNWTPTDGCVLQTYKELKRLYHPKGHIYFEPPNGEFDCLGYTSHFFDRYMQRMYIKNKDAAIRTFMKGVLIQDVIGMKAIKIPGSKRREEVIALIANGVGLGVKIDNTIIFKTFISPEQVGQTQIKNLESIKLYLKDIMDDKEYLQERDSPH